MQSAHHMVNGQICCIGSPLQLKNKFGNGYTVLIRVSPWELENSETITNGTNVITIERSASMQRRPSEHRLKQNIARVEQFMRDIFPTCRLKAVHNNLLHYAIEAPVGDADEVRCSEIFGAIEKAKRQLRIEDYSVCQTNLEQIFLGFARKQRSEDRRDDDEEDKVGPNEAVTRM